MQYPGTTYLKHQHLTTHETRIVLQIVSFNRCHNMTLYMTRCGVIEMPDLDRIFQTDGKDWYIVRMSADQFKICIIILSYFYLN